MLDLALKRWLCALCCSALLGPGAANAAGLGRLTILSGLGQPLNAEVELLSPQKGETLTARLASIDLYQQANLPYNAALVGARVTVERRADGRPYIKITTSLRVSEPFAELLVELNSENGRVTRQYTVLLDPPGYGRAASEIPPPAVAPPAVRPPAPTQEARAPAAAPAPIPSEPVARAPAAATARAPVGRPAPPPPTEPSSASTPIKQYGPVKRGETLGRIARTVQPAGVTLEQTLVGLYRENPDAFLRKNMNLVKSGRILKVPEPSELAGLPQRDAVTEVRLQSADFESFRGRLADRAGSAAEAGSVTSGRIGARVAGREPAEPRDTVRVSRAETLNQAGTKGSPDRLRALEEEMVAREKALADANDRIAQLEKTIKDMQRLAQMKGAGSTPPLPAGSGAGPQPSGGMGTVPSSTVVGPAAAPSSAVPPVPGPVAVLPAPAVDAGAKPVEGTKPGDAAQPVDATQQAAPQKKPAAPAKAPPAAAPPPSPATDTVDLILGEPMYLAAGGAVLVAGLALVALRRRRSGQDRVVKIAPTLASSTRPDVTPDPVSVRRNDVATPPAVNTSARYAPPASPSVPPPSAPAVPSPRPTPAPASAVVSAVPIAVGSAADTRATQTPPLASVPPASVSAEAPTKPDAADDNDLDFNAGTPSAAPAVAPAPVTTGLAATAPVTLPLPATPAPPVPTSPPATPVESAEAASSRKLKVLQETFEKSLAQARNAESSPREISFADFSLDDSKSEPQARPSAGAEQASNELTFEPLPAIDRPPDGKRSADAPDLDFQLTDLNLDGAGPTSAGVPKDEHWYDVQQKFDLAKAYQEMGDKQGARDILGEVLKEGDNAQQAQAQKVLSSLG